MRHVTGLIVGALMFPLSSGALAAGSDTITSVIDELRSRVADLEVRDARNQAVIASLQRDLVRVQQGSDELWLTEQRADVIRALVSDLLADADMRSIPQQSGATAGWDDGFFIGSADDTFRLNIAGLTQVRHITDWRDNASNDDHQTGFQVDRANLFLSGHIGSPKVKYLITLASGNNRNIVAEDAKISYSYNDNTTVYAGRFRNHGFLREESMSYARQMAVERSTFNEHFTLDYVHGVGFQYMKDNMKWNLVLHNGTRSASTSFASNAVDFAINTRVDMKLDGSWKEASDFSAMGTEGTSMVIGGAFSYQRGDTGSGSSNNDYWTWTIDGSWENSEGWSLYAAIAGRHSDNDTNVDRDQIGYLIQGAMMVSDKMEPFIRYESIDYDGNTNVNGVGGSTADNLGIITAGLNYYINGHRAKLTLDVQHALDKVESTGTFLSTGFQDDSAGQDGQTVIRAQFQHSF